jgi:hypothetical protein
MTDPERLEAIRARLEAAEHAIAEGIIVNAWAPPGAGDSMNGAVEFMLHAPDDIAHLLEALAEANRERLAAQAAAVIDRFKADRWRKLAESRRVQLGEANDRFDAIASPEDLRDVVGEAWRDYASGELPSEVDG